MIFFLMLGRCASLAFVDVLDETLQVATTSHMKQIDPMIAIDAWRQGLGAVSALRALCWVFGGLGGGGVICRRQEGYLTDEG